MKKKIILLIILLLLSIFMIGAVSAASDNNIESGSDATICKSKTADMNLGTINKETTTKKSNIVKNNANTINNKSTDTTTNNNNKLGSKIKNNTKSDKLKDSYSDYNTVYYTTTVIDDVTVYTGESFKVDVYVNGLPETAKGFAYLYPVSGQYKYENLNNGVATFNLKAPNTAGQIKLTGGYVAGTSGVSDRGSSTEFTVNVINKNNNYNSYDDYDDDYNYNDYDDSYDDTYNLPNAYIKSKTVYYNTNNKINFGWKGNLDGYFKVYKGNKQVYSYYLYGYNKIYTYNPQNLNAGTYTTKLTSDGKTVAKGKIIVKKVPSKISVKIKPASGTKFTYHAYVYNKKDNTELNEGYVKFKIKGKTYKAKVKNGEAQIKFKVPKKTGTYLCKAQYIGTKNIQKSETKTKKIKVFKITVATKLNKKISKSHGEYSITTHKTIPHHNYAHLEIGVYKNGKRLKNYKAEYQHIASGKKCNPFIVNVVNGNSWKRTISYNTILKTRKLKATIWVF